MLRFVAAAVALSSVSLSADDAILLRHKATKDDKRTYRSEINLSMTQQIAGLEFTSESEMETLAVHSLDRIDEKGNIRIRIEEKELKIDFNIPNIGEYTFDSTSSEQQDTPLAKGLNPFFQKLATTKSITVITPLGRVETIEGSLEAANEAAKDNPIAAEFHGNPTLENYKYLASLSIPVFSEKPVKPNDSWEVRIDSFVTADTKVVGKQIYTYDVAETFRNRKTAKLKVRNDLVWEAVPGKKGPSLSGSLPYDDLESVVQFDVEKGHVVLTETQVSVGGTLTLGVGDVKTPVRMVRKELWRMELVDKPTDAAPQK